MYSTIFGVAIFCIATLFVLCGVLKGKKYVWVYSAMRLGAAAIALVLALFLSGMISQAVIGVVLDAVADLDMMSSVKGFLNDLPTVKEAVCAILSMILTPGLFFTLFFIIKLIRIY